MTPKEYLDEFNRLIKQMRSEGHCTDALISQAIGAAQYELNNARERFEELQNEETNIDVDSDLFPDRVHGGD